MVSRAQFALPWRWALALVLVSAALSPSTDGPKAPRSDIRPTTSTSHPRAGWQDSLHDGFPDAARLAAPADRAAFLHWLTFLAEAQFYQPDGKQPSSVPAEIHDCAGLIRFAFRNALLAHNGAWRERMRLDAGGYDAPDFGDIQSFTYPNWVLRASLFRTRPGAFVPADLENGTFAQFADVATLLRYNTFPISRDVRAAQAGDLLFYHQPGQSEPFHSMLFVGRSYFRPQGADWVVYHTGDLDGRPGEVREVQITLLMNHPDPRWRPLTANPRFLGVYRFELLR